MTRKLKTLVSIPYCRKDGGGVWCGGGGCRDGRPVCGSPPSGSGHKGRRFRKAIKPNRKRNKFQTNYSEVDQISFPKLSRLEKLDRGEIKEINDFFERLTLLAHENAWLAAFTQQSTQGCGSGSAWIRIHFLSWIRIHIQEGKFWRKKQKKRKKISKNCKFIEKN